MKTSILMSKDIPESTPSRKFRGIARVRNLSVFLLGFLLLVPQSARGGEIAALGGIGVLEGNSPFVKLSLSFGQRVALDFNGGIVFADASELRFSDFTKRFSVKEKISNAAIPTGNQLYSVGLEVRGFVRKAGRRHNAYVGAGVDWLPQLRTYYPGVKVVTGYQLSILKGRNLVMRFGTEYYVYGVLPANTLTLTTSLGYGF